ncbi:MAG: MBOAT family protein [Clostridia bacterium]|nr:MBOAT family protein [Clostridia bacterium]
MVFNSFGFILVFFPLCFILIRRLPKTLMPYALILFSLAFYGLNVRQNPWQWIPLLGLTGLGALGFYCVRRTRSRALCALFVALTALPLSAVKLSGLFMKSPLPLPLGMSFYTFQLIALLIYARVGSRGTALDAAAGALMFPKLISGPIADPEDLIRTVRSPRRRRADIDTGLSRFILGLCAKVIIADHLSGVFGQIRTWGAEGVSVPMAWLGMICYALRLYFDFWGYSLMAQGVGAMLGYRLPDNFDHPYCSLSMTQFWRRWHMTLGKWFRNYVYIPMGGSRHGAARTLLATLTVWLLTGIWHGAGWNYVCWGLMMFILLTGERFVYGRVLERCPIAGHIYVPLLASLSWVFFSTPDIQAAVGYFQRLVGLNGMVGDAGDWVKALRWCWPYLSLGIVFSTPLPGRLWKKLSGTAAGWLILFDLFWVCMYFLATGANDPFLYFSF